MPVTTLRTRPTDTDSTLVVQGCKLTPTGLVVDAQSLSFDDWENVGTFLAHMHGALQWWVGDWVLIGEDRFGERAAQAMDLTGWQYNTITQMAWVCKNVPIERRWRALSFSHHREIADLPADGQTEWLDRAQVEGWNANRLRAELRAANRAAKGLDPEPYWLLVSCDTITLRDQLADRLTLEGYPVKTVERKG